MCTCHCVGAGHWGWEGAKPRGSRVSEMGGTLQCGSRVSGVGGAPLHTKQLSDSAGHRALTTLVILKHTGLLGP